MDCNNKEENILIPKYNLFPDPFNFRQSLLFPGKSTHFSIGGIMLPYAKLCEDRSSILHRLIESKELQFCVFWLLTAVVCRCWIHICIGRKVFPYILVTWRGSCGNAWNLTTGLPACTGRDFKLPKQTVLPKPSSLRTPWAGWSVESIPPFTTVNAFFFHQGWALTPVKCAKWGKRSTFILTTNESSRLQPAKHLNL